jgi:uncharacterized caspase-like protein
MVARRRPGLAIGNTACPNRPLANPVRDAEALAPRLRELGLPAAKPWAT